MISSDSHHEDDGERQKNDIDLSRRDESLKDFTNEVNGRVVLLAYGRALCTRARVFHTHVEQIDSNKDAGGVNYLMGALEKKTCE